MNFQKLLPQSSDPCGRIVYGNQAKTDLHMFVGRMDYQLSAKFDIRPVFGRQQRQPAGVYA